MSNGFASQIRRSSAALLCAGLAAAAFSPALPAAAAVPASVLVQTGGFADLVEQVMPAVVNIAAPQTVGRDAHGQPAGRMAVAQGSGFVVDPTGYIVTNAHVVGGAQEILATLQDGRRLEAKLVGVDAKTDIALLKVEAKDALPFVAFGDSDAVRVGDPVVAIGTPFGLGGTVTAGILSARARNIGSGPYDDFLQIDAAINSGNSGGPTFALDGRVIGINTAIFSPSGGSVGIGFAIPSNMAQRVVDELRDHGSVRRSWIGVSIAPVTPDVAAALKRPELQGAVISALVDGGPAARAKLKAGDVILAIAGEPVDDIRDVTRRVAEAASGSVLPFTILRDGKERIVTITLARMPDETAAAR